MAVDFNGDADYINYGDVAVLDFGSATDFTVSAWINTTTQAVGDFLGKGDSQDIGDNNHWSIGMTATGTFRAFIDDGVNTKLTTSDGTLVDDGVWHHIAITFDRDGNMTRYVDGVATGTADDISAVGNVSSSAGFSIGRRGNRTADYYNGIIDDVALWNTLLTASEIAVLHGAQSRLMPLQIQPSNLVFYDPLDEVAEGGAITTASIWKDISGNGATGTGVDADADSFATAGQILSYPGFPILMTTSAPAAGVTIPIFDHHYRMQRSA